jgi:hypothetical protein
MLSIKDYVSNDTTHRNTILTLISEINSLKHMNNHIKHNIIPTLQQKYLFLGIIKKNKTTIQCILFNSYIDPVAPVINIHIDTFNFINQNKNSYDTIRFNNYTISNKIAINCNEIWKII